MATKSVPLTEALIIGAAATLSITSMGIGYIQYKQSGGKRGSFRPVDYVLLALSFSYLVYTGGDITKGLE